MLHEPLCSREEEEVEEEEEEEEVESVQLQGGGHQEHQQQELDKWAGGMTAPRYLQLYPDPREHFTGAGREPPEGPAYREHALADLLARFPYQSKADVVRAMGHHKLYIKAVRHLMAQPNSRKKQRSKYEKEKEMPQGAAPVEFLKERKYLELEGEIEKLKAAREKELEAKVAAAREAGLLQECGICCRDDCLEEQMVGCGAGHLCCDQCANQAAGVAAGDNLTAVACGECSEEIDWQQLERVVDPVVLSKLLQRRQAEEVNVAGLEGLVTCPFCPYATVMENEADKVLVCRFPACGRESCRLCRESNHVPLRCDEVEKTEGARKEIEENLTQAMIRECWNCHKKVRLVNVVMFCSCFSCSSSKKRAATR